MISRLKDVLEPVQQALFPPDPGSARLIGAARATLGGVLALVVALALRSVTPMPFEARVTGFTVATFLGALVRDPSPGQQAWTIALSPLPVFAITVLVAVARPIPHLADLLTLAAVFAAICAASCGPRWATLGATSLIGLLVALLSRVTPADLASRLVVLIVAAASAGLARFVILPDRPATQLRRLRRAIGRGMAGVLAGVETAVREGSWRDGEPRRLRRAMARLNEAVMLAERLLSPADGLHLLECELVTERVARIAFRDLGTQAEIPDLLQQLAALRSTVLDGTVPPLPRPLLTQPDSRSASQLAGALAGMALLLARPLPDALGLAAAPTPAAVARPPWATLEVRPAIQATLATALAIIGGSLISPDRWYWAVFSAFVLFQGTRSRGESIARAVEMMLGTLAGVVAGVLLATLLAGQAALEMAAIVVGVFLAFFASTAAYGVMVFWITIVLGLLFGMLGYFPEGLLLLRLKETAVGAAAGIAVAWMVLARPTPGLVRSSAASFLQALGAVVQSAARPLLDQPLDAGLSGLTLGLEQRYQALRVAAAPHLPGSRLLGAERTRRLLLLLGACDEWARELVRNSLHLPAHSDPALSAVAAQATARIAGSIAGLTAMLEGRRVTDAQVLAEPAATGSVPEGDDPAVHAARLLLRVDAALLHLRQKLTA